MKETSKNWSKAEYRPEFRERYRELPEEVREVLSVVLAELARDYAGRPWAYTGHDTAYIPPEDVWRVKVKEGPADHRIYLDMEEDGTLVFLTVYHKDDE